MGFKQQLQEILREKELIPPELLTYIPKGFQDLDRRAILKLNPKLDDYAEAVAAEIPKILPRIIAVWNRGGQIKGKFRTPMGLTHLWGEESTEVIVNENNVRYKFDFTKIMFAKGNIHERNLLPQKIQPGEFIVDMFAGIGYFSLGIAKSRKPQKVLSIEWNPEAFQYLKENIRLNHVEDIITPYFGDCKQIVSEFSDEGIRADRVIMGLLPAPVDAIPFALKLVKDQGTIFVYEGVEGKESTKLFDEFNSIAQEQNYQCSIIERRIVKNFKPHEYHVVVEIMVKPQSAGNP